MTKFFKTIVQDGDSKVALFIPLDEKSIAIDLDSSAGSFILTERKFAHGPIDDYVALAKGALSHQNQLKGYNGNNAPIIEVESMPSGLVGHPMGGNSKNGIRFAVSVYEDRSIEHTS